MSEQDPSAGEMEECEVVGGVIFITHDESSTVMEPGKEPFDFPALAIAAQAAAIVKGGLGSASPVRAQEDYALCEQLFAQRIAVVSFVGDQTQRLFLDQATLQGRFHQ